MARRQVSACQRPWRPPRLGGISADAATIVTDAFATPAIVAARQGRQMRAP